MFRVLLAPFASDEAAVSAESWFPKLKKELEEQKLEKSKQKSK